MYPSLGKPSAHIGLCLPPLTLSGAQPAITQRDGKNSFHQSPDRVIEKNPARDCSNGANRGGQLFRSASCPSTSALPAREDEPHFSLLLA